MTLSTKNMSEIASWAIFGYVLAMTVLQGWFLHSRDRIPGWFGSLTWVTAAVIPIYSLANPATRGEQWAAAFMILFVAVVSFQLGRDRIPESDV